MLAYVRRLLVAAGYRVETVRDGLTPLATARRLRPDLILSDVMMPGLDGFALLRAIRADNELRETPIILLSARAGEEARAEGLNAGADDYLVKPFSARELIARVTASLKLAHVRTEAAVAMQESEERLRLAMESAEVGLWDLDVATGTLFWPPRVKAMFGMSPDASVSMADFHAGLHPDDADRIRAAFAAALDPERRAYYDVEYRTVGKADGIVRWIA